MFIKQTQFYKKINSVSLQTSIDPYEVNLEIIVTRSRLCFLFPFHTQNCFVFLSADKTVLQPNRKGFYEIGLCL